MEVALMYRLLDYPKNQMIAALFLMLLFFIPIFLTVRSFLREKNIFPKSKQSKKSYEVKAKNNCFIDPKNIDPIKPITQTPQIITKATPQNTASINTTTQPSQIVAKITPQNTEAIKSTTQPPKIVAGISQSNSNCIQIKAPITVKEIPKIIQTPPENKAPESKPITYLNQKEATEQVISETSFDLNLSLDEMNRLAKERSDKLYHERQQRILSFDPFYINENLIDTTPLTSMEKYFLKQMNGQEIKNPLVYAYWIYEYSLDFAKVMTKFLGNDYLYISGQDYDFGSSTCAELKEILKTYGLSSNGLKKELIQRIQDNIPLEQIQAAYKTLPQKYFLTKKGKTAILNLHTSMTRNLEFEDACLEFISSKQFNNAYQLVCDFELNKIIPRGIGIDWNKEKINGLSNFKEKLFTDFFENTSDISLQITTIQHLSLLKSCIILGVMLGTDVTKIVNLFARVSGVDKKLVSTPLVQKLLFMLMDKIQNHCY